MLRKDRSPGRPLDAQFQPLNRPSMPLLISRCEHKHFLLQLYPKWHLLRGQRRHQVGKGQTEQLINHVGKKAARGLDTPVLLWSMLQSLSVAETVVCPSKKVICLVGSLFVPWWMTHALSGGISVRTHARQLQVIKSNVLSVLVRHVRTVFASLCQFHFFSWHSIALTQKGATTLCS